MSTTTYRKGQTVQITGTTLRGTVTRKVRGQDEYDVWVTFDRFVARPGQTVRGPESDIRRYHARDLYLGPR